MLIIIAVSIILLLPILSYLLNPLSEQKSLIFLFTFLFFGSFLINFVSDNSLLGSWDQEIKAYVSKRFGDFSNYRPALTGANYFLWFGPLIFFAFMLTVFFYKRGT